MKRDLPAVETQIELTMQILEDIDWLFCGPDFTEKILARQFEPHRKSDVEARTGGGNSGELSLTDKLVDRVIIQEKRDDDL